MNPTLSSLYGGGVNFRQESCPNAFNTGEPITPRPSLSSDLTPNKLSKKDSGKRHYHPINKETVKVHERRHLAGPKLSLDPDMNSVEPTPRPESRQCDTNRNASNGLYSPLQPLQGGKRKVSPPKHKEYVSGVKRYPDSRYLDLSIGSTNHSKKNNSQQVSSRENPLSNHE